MKQLYSKDVVDSDTGEVKQSTWIRTKRMPVESFLRAYVQDIGVLAKCSKAEISTVLCCLKYVEWNSNELFLNKKRREEVAECGGLTFNTVNCSISRLVKKRILLKVDGRLLLNPIYFFFGSDLGKLNTVNLILQYHIKPDSDEL